MDTEALLKVTVIGIANSVEVFKGELTNGMTFADTSSICKNELKIIFKPYTKEDLSDILLTIVNDFIQEVFPKAKHSKYR